MQTLEVDPSRHQELAAAQAARTAFQISGAVLSLAPSFPELELTFPEPMYQFDAGDRRCSSSKILEAEHRTEPKLDRSVILFDQIIQIF